MCLQRDHRGRILPGKMLRLLTVVSLLCVLQACATVHGMGEDIQSLGRAMKRAVSG
ncbi:MAG: entericidin A/B family lipoprotein [Candidatus Binatia bacterium]